MAKALLPRGTMDGRVNESRRQGEVIRMCVGMMAILANDYASVRDGGRGRPWTRDERRHV
jgi:hypothetical protein